MINIAILSKQRNNFLYEFISKELFKENYEYRIIKTAKLDELVDKKKNYEIVIIDLDDTSYPGNSIAKELYFFNKEMRSTSRQLHSCVLFLGTAQCAL